MGVRVSIWTLVLFLLISGMTVDVRAEDDEGGDDPDAPSVSIAPVRGSTQIPHPAGRKWKLGERACSGNGKCGTVRMVTRDYAVIEGERARAKPAPKKKKREVPEDYVEPAPKPLEPEPPSGFFPTPEEPVLIPDSTSQTPTAPTGPVRKRTRLPKLESTKPKRRPPLHAWWAHVQLNVVGAFRESGAKLFSPEVSWNPTFEFEDNFRIRAHLGAMAFKNETGSYFGVIEPAVFASFGAGVLRVEPGAGAQFWLGQGGLFPLLQMNFVMSFEGMQDTPRFFESVFIAPAIVFSNVIPTYMVKAGFGFAF